MLMPLQGWLKGINSTSLNPDFDMGNDGKTGTQNQYTARDAYGINLNYFTVIIVLLIAEIHSRCKCLLGCCLQAIV
jgi:hypothetical protein